MSDQTNHYTDSSFNLYQAYSYTLLLKVGPASFDYAVVHERKLLASAQNCDLDELAHPKQLSELLTSTYQKVIVGLSSTGFTLVPKSLFSEENVAGFARLLDVKETEKVFAQRLDAENMIIYKANVGLISAVEKFDLQNMVYTASGWVRAVTGTSPRNDALYLEITDGTVQFLCFSAYRLRFYNTFEFSNADELVYFTTFVAEELKLKAKQTTLILSGDINPGDANMNRLADFYPKIEINGIKVMQLPGQIASYQILALAALSLCGSSEER